MVNQAEKIFIYNIQIGKVRYKTIYDSIMRILIQNLTRGSKIFLT